MLRRPTPAQVPSQVKTNEPVRPLHRQSNVPSIVSSEMTIHGDLQSSGDLQIEGTVVGEIEVGKLVIAEGGTVSGNIVAKDVRICGSLNGSVRSVMITLTSTARVVGDLYHEVLAIEAGGQLEGQSRRWVPGSPELLQTVTAADEHRDQHEGEHRDYHEGEQRAAE